MVIFYTLYSRLRADDIHFDTDLSYDWGSFRKFDGHVRPTPEMSQ